MNRGVIGLYLITLGVASIFVFIGIANDIVPGFRTVWNLRHATVGVYSIDTTASGSRASFREMGQSQGFDPSMEDRHEVARRYTFDKPKSCIRNSLYEQASVCARPVVELRLSLALALSILLIGAGGVALFQHLNLSKRVQMRFEDS